MAKDANVDLAVSRDSVELVKQLIDIPSESFEEAELASAVERFLSRYRHLRVARHGNTIVADTNMQRAARLIIAGHLDTVPANGNSEYHVDGDRIYGLGATDMKGGVAVALRLAAEVHEPMMDVTYIFYDCEEVDSAHNGLRKLAESQPSALDCDFAILMEPSNAVIEAGCQGSLRVEVAAAGRRAHSARAWMGDNAIHNASQILERLTRYVPATVEIDGLAYREGLNAVLVRGGVAGNVIPDECVVTVNYRYSPASSPDEAITHVQELFEGFAVTVIDNAPGAMPGLTSPLGSELIEMVGATSVQPKLGWTDVARFAALGIPAVNYGPGDPTLAHTRDEFVTTEQIVTCQRNLQRFLEGR